MRQLRDLNYVKVECEMTGHDTATWFYRWWWL